MFGPLCGRTLEWSVGTLMRDSPNVSPPAGLIGITIRLLIGAPARRSARFGVTVGRPARAVSPPLTGYDEDAVDGTRDAAQGAGNGNNQRPV